MCFFYSNERVRVRVNVSVRVMAKFRITVRVRVGVRLRATTTIRTRQLCYFCWDVSTISLPYCFWELQWIAPPPYICQSEQTPMNVPTKSDHLLNRHDIVHNRLQAYIDNLMKFFMSRTMLKFIAQLRFFRWSDLLLLKYCQWSIFVYWG